MNLIASCTRITWARAHFDSQNTACYTPAVSSNKGLIGCESPMARGAKPHPARFAAFLFQALFGGPDGRAQALPVTLRVPRSLTPVRAAAQCESWSAVVHQAQLEINMKQPSHGAQAPDIERLRAVITDIDALCQGAFSEIASVAKLALIWLEQPASHRGAEVIAAALSTIYGKAKDAENLINCEAESVGCNFSDPATTRRHAAYRVAHQGEPQKIHAELPAAAGSKQA
jgi:hypothetical protein